MDVASLDISKELFELSDWFDTFAKYYLIDGALSIRPSIKTDDEWLGHQLVMKAPAYDLGFLIRNLPPLPDPEFGDEEMYHAHVVKLGEDHYFAGYYGENDDSLWGDWSDNDTTPEGALAKLAIELFKQGILTKGKL